MVLQYIPIANLLMLVFGFIYGIAILKIALKSFTDKLERIATLTDSHEHRLTIVETQISKRD